MKRNRKSMAALILACSLVLAPASGAEGAIAEGGTAESRTAESSMAEGRTAESSMAEGRTAESSTAESSMAESSMAESSTAEGSTAEEQTDPETGYTYRLLQDSTGQGVTVQQIEITGCTGSATDLAIPAEIRQYQVTSIGVQAFKGNTTITCVKIPEGVTKIGREAFQGCESLTEVTVPSTVTDWDDDIGSGYSSRAFQGCTALRSLELAEGLTALGQEAFADCTALEKVAVPSTITECHNKIFAGCIALRTVELPEGIQEMGYHAFQDCTALQEIEIPSTIQSWGLLRASGIMATLHDSAPFEGCANLEKITFREGLRTLRDFQGARGCPKVTELDIPASVEDISYAFKSCTSLEIITLHEGIEVIGASAFEGCTALKELTVPDTVATVGATAFKGCTALERLVLPPAAMALEGGITDGCTSLKELYLLAEAVKWYQALSLPAGGKLYCVKGSSTYGIYQSGMAEADRDKLAAIPDTGVEATGCSVTYDGSPHPAASITGTREGDKIQYRLDSGSIQSVMPQITEPGHHTLEIKVRRAEAGEVLQYSCLRVQVQILKRQYAISLQDAEAEEGESYEITVQGYGGTGVIQYTYYKDAACTLPLAEKPEVAGVYYVRASVPEMDYDAPVESNVAKITIHGKELPDTEPSVSGNPGTDPTAGPGGNPGTNPTASPGGNPGTDPTASPGGNPGTDPTANPGGNPGANPTASPGGNPGANPSPSQVPGTSPSSGIKPGQTTNLQEQAVSKVKRPTVQKVMSKKKKTLQVQWRKVSGASGYQVQAALDKKFKKGKKNCSVTGGKVTKKIVRKLKRGRKYYVRIRAYKTVKGKKQYGKWSKVKSVKVK